VERAERYRMILGGHFGFGSHAFIKPFLKRSSTKGKLGRRGTYAMCCKCHSLYPQDEGAEESLARAGFDIDGIIPEHMHYDIANRAAEAVEALIKDPDKAEALLKNIGETGLPVTSKVRKLGAEVPPSPELEETTMSEIPENSRVRKLDAEVSSEPEAQESEVVEPLEPEVQESEVVEPPEEPKVGDVEPAPAVEPIQDPGGQLGTVVDDDPEVVRLREALDAAEREVEQRLEERRQIAEADLLKAETAKRVGELARQLEQVEAKLAQLDDPDWTPGTATPSAVTMKLHRKTCRCGSVVDMPTPHCTTCMAHIGNQLFAPSSYLCGNCSTSATESSESCSSCGAVFQE